MQISYTYKNPCNPCNPRHPWLNIKFLCLCTFLFIWMGCTKGEIHYLSEETVEGRIEIYPDCSEYVLPALEYHFYNTDITKEYVVCNCDGSGNFEGTLPVGTYRVIATNTGARNVTFSGMHSHEQATVSANPFNAPTRAGIKLSQVDDIFSTVMSTLVVSSSGVSRYEPAPVLLTKHLKLTFALQGNLKNRVIGLSGILPGVYPSVQLYSCTHSAESAVQSITASVGFDTSLAGTQHQAQISLFGLRDPKHGETYTNTLALLLKLNDGTAVPVTVNLTSVLSEIINQNEGTIPLHLAIPIEIKENELGIEGIVMGWINEGESEENVD